MKINLVILSSLLMLTGLVSFYACEKILPPEPDENEVLDGQMEGLTHAQTRLFLEGDEAFSEVFTPEKGLGAYFVTSSCFTCHSGDGKGHPSTTLTRFGRWENGQFDPLTHLGGGQLQNRAIAGFEAEEIPAEANGIARFTPPAVTGLGLLAAIPDSTLLDLADPDDMDGDGISGRVNYIEPPDFFSPLQWHIPDGEGRYIGRFGKKAAAIDLLHQTVNAYKQDMGITSDFDMEDPINYAVSAQQTDLIPDPEISAATVQSVVFYLRTLKAPIPRDELGTNVQLGKQLFNDIECSKCHLPTMKTGISDIEVLSEVEFHPYTDLLLHDMGEELNDNYTEGIAEAAEWRTPPLWGLGLSPDAQGGGYFLMHDGRATSIEEAILLHGGEALNSRTNYEELSISDKEALIAFLESL